jgi:hypothetical protein
MSDEQTPKDPTENPAAETPETTDGMAEPTAKVTQLNPKAEAPPVAGEQAEPAGDAPADPDLLGKLDPNELAIMTSLNQQSRQMVFQIGQSEINKQRLLAQLGQLEQQSHGQSQAIGKRLGIPDGTQWNVTPDGQVRKMQQPTPFTPPQQKAPGKN